MNIVISIVVIHLQKGFILENSTQTNDLTGILCQRLDTLPSGWQGLSIGLDQITETCRHLQITTTDADSLETGHLKTHFGIASFDFILCLHAASYITFSGGGSQALTEILKPGGMLIIADIAAPVHIKAARYINSAARLCQVWHYQPHTQAEWEGLLSLAGRDSGEITVETLSLNLWLSQWARNCDAVTWQRLRAMILQAPQPVREWLQIRDEPGIAPGVDIPFVMPYLLMTVRKP